MRSFLKNNTMKPKIALPKAKKLSILKWELIVKNQGEFSLEDRRHPQLINIKHNCGFCERWRNDLNEFLDSGCECAQCEFAAAMGCDCNSYGKKYNLFDRWCDAELFGDAVKLELAQRILDLIKSIPTTK